MLFGKDPNKEARQAEDRSMDFERGQQAIKQEPDYEEVMQKDVIRQDLLKWQQDLTDELEQLKHDLKRETYDVEKNFWVKQKILIGYDEEGKAVFDEMPPLLNDVGVTQIEVLCRSLLSRNLINSNLGDEGIRSILKRTCDVLVTNLANSYRLYDCEFTNLSLVVSLVKNIIIPTPYRALGGWTKKQDNTINKRIEAFSEGIRHDQPKKILGLFG